MADLVYVRRPERSLCLDLYLPERRPAPVIVWLHGGGWLKGDKGNPYVSFLANEGYAIADVAYRLTEECPAPGNLHDCLAALRWLSCHGARYGIDSRRMALSGGSAGAHLALLAAASPPHELWRDPAFDGQPVPPLKAVCALSGPTDLSCAEEIHGHPRAAEYVAMLSCLFGQPYGEDMSLAQALSPLNWVGAHLPPTLIIHGTDDSTIDISQSRTFVAAMRAVGADIEYHEEPGGDHGRDSWNWPVVAGVIRTFFHRVLPLQR